MFEIEFNEPFHSVCTCCDSNTTSLTRFVKRDGNAYAVYYAFFTEGHSGLTGLISIGEWGTEKIPKDRYAFGFDMMATDESYQVMIINAEQTPWGKADILGQKLTREEAMLHPWLEDVYEITDLMADRDDEVREFFGQEIVH